jgi:multiple sugar transport system substrate-binding protein
VLDDIIPSIREECTIDGKLYSWPFLLDVIGNSWHSGMTTKAGLPDTAPETWDEYLERPRRSSNRRRARSAPRSTRTAGARWHR